jgi:hypothetical protein
MDIDINSVLDRFIRNFVPKDKRESSGLQLKEDKNRVEFTGSLSHKWDTLLDMGHIAPIPSGVADHEFVTKQLGIVKNELWYIISSNKDIDGQIADFNTAFDKVYGRGFGSLIIHLNGDKLYLETEVAQGKQNRFIGKLN